MEKLDKKKAVMNEVIGCNDLGFSDWENFTDDIDIASLEHSLQMTESNTETLNDKIINFQSDGEYSQKKVNTDLDFSTWGRIETLQDESFEDQLCSFIPSIDSSTLPLNPSSFGIGEKSNSADFLRREPTVRTAYNLPRKMDSFVSNVTTRNTYIPSEKILLSDPEQSSFSFQDNFQPQCTSRDQRLLVQEYPTCKDANLFSQNNCDGRMQNEENQKYTGVLPHVSRLQVSDIQENSVPAPGPETIVSSKVINSNQKNTSYKNITPCKENFNSGRMIFLREENFDSQKMIISSQESSDSQRMIISSQETSDSQKMITSSQESSSSEKMIISSQEFSDSQKMITFSQDISDSQKMIISSQDSHDDPRMIILNQESFGNQNIISSLESVASKNLLMSNQVSEDHKIIQSSQETSVRHKKFNTRSGSFLKISKKINLKTDNKSYPNSRLSLKDKKLHKFLDFKRLEGVMKTQYDGKEVFSPASMGKKCGNFKESSIIRIGELKVRKIEIGMNKQKKFISSRR